MRQFADWVMARGSPYLAPGASKHQACSSKPTAFTSVFRCQTGDMQTPSDLATQRDSKNDSIFGARREMQPPHDAMHRASMGVTELQSNWPEMRKPLNSQES